VVNFGNFPNLGYQFRLGCDENLTGPVKPGPVSKSNPLARMEIFHESDWAFGFDFLLDGYRFGLRGRLGGGVFGVDQFV
jgi:hypothetical protein